RDPPRGRAPGGVELPADAVALERRVDDDLGTIERAAALGVVVREHAVGGEVFPAVEHVVALPEHDEARTHADHSVLVPVDGDELSLPEDAQVGPELLRRPGPGVRRDAPAEVAAAIEVARLRVPAEDPLVPARGAA